MADRIEIDRARWTQDDQGTWICFRVPNSKQAISMSQSVTEPMELTLSKKRNRRSLDANAYCWVLLDKLAEKLQIPKVDIYKNMIRNIGGNSDTVCVILTAADRLCASWEGNGIGWVTERVESKLEGCMNVILYYGSSTYDTAQMSRLLNMIVDECKEQGIETMTPDEIARLRGLESG